MENSSQSRIFIKLRQYCDGLSSDFSKIPIERKIILNRIKEYIASKIEEKEINLIYVCTHNSRRSHFGQIWAAVAAEYYGIHKIKAHSAGTEATAFHPNAIAALARIGFKMERQEEGKNPLYKVHYGEKLTTICFSKTITHESFPSQNFAAIMTCGDAEANCPFLRGAEKRIATTYEDPKKFDGTELEMTKYDERCREIALETLYIFSQV
ncbi:MAG: protein-tyrosine-phosphatase [Brumimicrobium sp.]|nr:protein-tyrosine-phosphatase [Brumimicrobium sp.]